jgi:hypothetical protein
VEPRRGHRRLLGGSRCSAASSVGPFRQKGSNVRLSSLRSLAAITAVIALPRCATEACGCPPLMVSALVHGRVMSPTAEPVVGALVHAYSAPAAGCNADELTGYNYGFIATRADGTYSLQLAASEARDSICVFVFAQPAPGASGLIESDTALVVLDFNFAGPEDSVRVDPVLRPL